MTTTRAAYQQGFGGPELLTITDVELPEVGPRDVLVDVKAAGLNPVDYKIAAYPRAAEMFGVTVPGGYGNDFSGVIAAVGSEVTNVAVGDRVVGGKRGGAVQQQTVVDSSAVEVIPDEVSFEAAATLPVPLRTAAAAIDQLHLTSEDTVLVGGAAGGVGVFTVQWAVRTGAVVIATASEKNHEFLRELGAIPVTYGEGLVERVRELTDRTVTAATDLQGTSTIEAAIELGVEPTRITAIAVPPGSTVADGVIVTGGGDASPDAIAKALELIAAGELRVVIAKTYPLEQVTEAVRELATGHVRGKIIIDVTA